MHPDVIALLAVQTDDVNIHEIEHGIEQLLPRVRALAADAERAAAALAATRQQIDAERKRRGDVEHRIAEHRQLHTKNQAVLNAITSQREATAAMAQLEQVTRFITDEEHELAMIAQRIDELDKLAEDREQTVLSIQEAMAEAEASVAVDRQALEKQLADARKSRETRSRAVPRGLLSKYDRLRSKRRVHALFPLRGGSCSHCDTVLPLQRRTEMLGSGVTEICEGCGVLLYVAE